MGNPKLIPKFIAEGSKARAAHVRKAKEEIKASLQRSESSSVAVPTRRTRGWKSKVVLTEGTEVDRKAAASSTLKDTQPSLHSYVTRKLLPEEERSQRHQTAVALLLTPKSKAVVPAELARKRGEGDGAHAKRLKKFVKNLCSEIQDLRYYNAEVEAELYMLEGLYKEQSKHVMDAQNSLKQINVQVDKEEQKAHNAVVASADLSPLEFLINCGLKMRSKEHGINWDSMIVPKRPRTKRPRAATVLDWDSIRIPKRPRS